jgi:hypothetical protein
VGGDDGGGRLGDVSAGKVMRFEVFGADADSRLHERDFLFDDHVVIDIPELHADQVGDTDLGSGEQTLNPESHKAEENNQDEDAEQHEDCQGDQHPGFFRISSKKRVYHHGEFLSGWIAVSIR